MINPHKNPTEILTKKQTIAVVEISKNFFLSKFLKDTLANKIAV